MKHVIMVDFDGVLFNDVRFKKAYMREFRNAHVSDELYTRVYKAAKKNKGGIYDPGVHLREIKRVIPGVNVSMLQKAIKKMAQHSQAYVFSGTAAGLRALAKKRAPLILLSTGSSFQKQKIRYSGLHKHFSQIIVTQHISKIGDAKATMRKFGASSGVFIDDKKQVVDEIKQNIPELHVIQVARRNAKRSVYADEVVSSFVHASRCIQKVLRKVT